jgi:S1-C subfamily serine protease
MSVRIVLMFLFCKAAVLSAAQIPPFFVDSVVALGRMEVRVPNQPAEWVAEASGFLYGRPIDQETDPAKHEYEVFLVTNRHVLLNHISITIRLNPEKVTDPVQEHTLALKAADGTDLWISHPNTAVDISVIRMNPQFMRDHGLKVAFFSADRHVADRAKLRDIGLAIGDGVFVLGFPMGLSGTNQRNYVIARRGSIARISDLLDSTASNFLIDALIYPGNSGGPVVSSPNMNAIEGTKSQDRAYLIGMVRAYLPYTDVALSQQTGQVRLISQENSGLAEVIPVDFIDETINAFWKRFPITVQMPPKKN